MVDGRGGEGSGGKASDMIECIKKQRGPTNHQLKSPVWPEEGGSQGAVDIARRSTDEELYRKLDEDGGKQMIFKMARGRTEDGREMKSGAVIYDNNERLITESKELLRIWAANFKELLYVEGAAS